MFSEKVLLIVKNFKKILEDLVEDEDMLYNVFMTRLTLPFDTNAYNNEVILEVNSSTDYSFTHKGEKTTFKYPILHPKFEFELCKYFNSIEMMIYEGSIDSNVYNKKLQYQNKIQKSFFIEQDTIPEVDEKRVNSVVFDLNKERDELVKEREENLKSMNVSIQKSEKLQIKIDNFNIKVDEYNISIVS